MRCLFVLALFATAALAFSSKEAKSKFTEFEHKFGKKWSSKVEREERFNIFQQNLAKIEHHNKYSGATWTMAVNQFTDLTDAEFRATLNGYKNVHKSSTVPPTKQSKIDISQLPESVDWRDKGAITKPKDQGGCGSCWAFATIEQMESYAFLTNGTLPELSAQHVTTCTPNPLMCGGSGGCQGSIPQLGYSYIQLFGLVNEDDWPYTATSGTCDYDPSSLPAKVNCRGYETLPHNDLQAVMNHLANVGPLAIAVDASPWSFYGGGVFDGCSYSQNININHAVQLVGYGTDPQEGDYWIVRNSWGGNWGLDGYIHLKRESSAECGLDSTPLMGTACENDGNDVQTVCGMCGTIFDTSYPIGTVLLN